MIKFLNKKQIHFSSRAGENKRGFHLSKNYELALMTQFSTYPRGSLVRLLIHFIFAKKEKMYNTV